MGAVKIVKATRLDPRFPLSRRELAAVCDTILDALDLVGRTFTLTLTDDRNIAAVNSAFLGCTGPTNVLSFPADDGDETAVRVDGDDLGELVLSVDTLARETELYGQEPIEHLARLLAHGILHLAGFDHGQAMFDLTDAAVDRVIMEAADRLN
ncbi:rRNA maturation RNase YbeY [Pseudodesulfovibrio portus]|uniref:Endoribonuclease YbeY n=1 Tax=Pseudodesulfovibrio portus TaxID=231439 RepID=A0ABM8ANZ5_9BACT|nr:rRNA maturation RNase YbeY [Pseudodesulfovibrio portus]BDQ33116.1 endoribonuclease YbeY [Pseudodesulfovibrio portus]